MSLKNEIRLIPRDILFVLRLLIGFVLIIIGLVGLVFPIMPDWILIIVGLLFFDANGKIAKFIISFLPKNLRKKSTDYALKIEAKIDKILGKWR